MALEYIQEMWSGLLAGSRIERHEFLLRFTEAPSVGANGAALAIDQDADIVLDADAWSACQALAELLVEASTLHSRVDSIDLQLEIMREAARVLRSSDYDRTATSLILRLNVYVSKSIVVIPVGGMYSSAQDPLTLGDRVVVGHVSREAERAIAELARRQSPQLAGFRFTDDAWWTEEFLAAEADPGIAEEIAEAETEEGIWQPLVVASAIDAIGGQAAYTAAVCVEALIGAVLAVDDPQDLDRVAPPWILGEATYTENPRSPRFGDDFLLPTAPLVVDTRPGHGIKGHAHEEFGRVGADVDLAELVVDPEARALLTAAVNGGHAPDAQSVECRFASACRLFARIVASPPDVGVVLAAATLRLLGVLAPGGENEAGSRNPVIHDQGTDSVELCELVDAYLSGHSETASVLDLALTRHDALHLVRRELLAAHARLR